MGLVLTGLSFRLKTLIHINSRTQREISAGDLSVCVWVKSTCSITEVTFFFKPH